MIAFEVGSKQKICIIRSVNRVKLL